MVVFFNSHLVDDCIASLPIDDSLERQWLRGSHNTHQNQTRSGLHEETSQGGLQQDTGVAPGQTKQGTGAVDTSGIPPYLKRKLLMRRDATSDGAEWICSDYSDDDEGEDEPQHQLQLGVEIGLRRIGEFPARVRRLRRRYTMMTWRMAAMKYAQDDHDTNVTAVLAQPQLEIQDSPRSGGRTRTGAETSETTSESYNIKNDYDELFSRRARLGSCHASGGSPANTDGACEVAAPPESGYLSMSSASGPRRSRRIREKLMGPA